MILSSIRVHIFRPRKSCLISLLLSELHMSTSQVMLEITTNQDELAGGIKTLRAYRIQMQTLCKHRMDIA
jgi:hypothetical protein